MVNGDHMQYVVHHDHWCAAINTWYVIHHYDAVDLEIYEIFIYASHMYIISTPRFEFDGIKYSDKKKNNMWFRCSAGIYYYLVWYINKNASQIVLYTFG